MSKPAKTPRLRACTYKSETLGALAPPQLLGQHTPEVLRELGVDDERLASLEERGVIARSAA